MEKDSKVASKIFGSVSKVYDSFLNIATLKKIHSWQNTLIQNTPLGKSILEVGTGTGEVVKKIKNKSPSSTVIGVDIAIPMLKVAKEKNPDVSFVCCDAHNLPFKSSSFDNIIFSLTFRHLNQDKIVEEVSRVLKKDGYLSILDIPKPESKALYKTTMFLMKVLFKPIARLIFSKDEYDYFVKSVEFAPTVLDLEKLLSKNGFKRQFLQKKLFGMIYIVVFRKVD